MQTYTAGDDYAEVVTEVVTCSVCTAVQTTSVSPSVGAQLGLFFFCHSGTSQQLMPLKDKKDTVVWIISSFSSPWKWASMRQDMCLNEGVLFHGASYLSCGKETQVQPRLTVNYKSSADVSMSNSGAINNSKKKKKRLVSDAQKVWFILTYWSSAETKSRKYRGTRKKKRKETHCELIAVGYQKIMFFLAFTWISGECTSSSVVFHDMRDSFAFLLSDKILSSLHVRLSWAGAKPLHLPLISTCVFPGVFLFDTTLQTPDSGLWRATAYASPALLWMWLSQWRLAGGANKEMFLGKC